MEQTKRFRRWEFGFVIVVFVLGTLWHFLYQWSGQVRWVGAVAPVNESTWEHLKILFFPALIAGIVEYLFIGKEIPHFLIAKSCGILCGMAAIVVVFYTYSGIVGRNFLWADILTFFIGVLAVCYGTGRILTVKSSLQLLPAVYGIVLLIVFMVCFIIFTFYPVRIGLFLDPVFKGYGI